MTITDSRTSRRAVTVIVPIYGDLPSLMDCIESLQSTVDTAVHSVLLVNDCGPDADEIEDAVVAAIRGTTGFRYERNPKNLGFVGNCNRAVFELDRSGNDVLLLNSDTVTTPGFIEELSAVLHSSPTHGVVCARSNNATIASIPHRLRAPAPRTIERSAAVHAALSPLLPRFSVSPVSMGFCFLVRRDLIDQYGLFDEIYAPGYGEENDFCLRINEAGYTSLIAHHAIVYHAGALSFQGEKRNALRSAHEAILVGRYPHYTASVQQYLWRDIDPIDHFADALIPDEGPMHLILDADDPRDLSDRSIVDLLDAMRVLPRDDVHLTLSVPPSSLASAAARFRGITVVPHDRSMSLYDLAIGLSPEISRGQLIRLNRSSPRWVFVGTVGNRVRRWGERADDSDSRTALLSAIRYGCAVIARDGSARAAVTSIAASDAETADTGAPVSDQQDSTTGSLVHEMLSLARAPWDAALLRRRWVAFSPSAQGASRTVGPTESVPVRLIRKARRVAPAPTALLERAARRLLRR